MKYHDLIELLDANPNLDMGNVLTLEANNKINLTDDERFEVQAYLQKKAKELDSNNETLNQGYVSRDSNNSPDYDDIHFEGDFSIPLKSWHELNPDSLSYWLWMQKIGVKYFWGTQPEIEMQATLLSVLCAVNSAAIPSVEKIGYDVQLPLILSSGLPRTGKTVSMGWIRRSYPVDRTAMIVTGSTGASIRNTIVPACWNGFKYLPSYVIFDNYALSDIIKYLANFRMLWLGVTKGQAYLNLGNSGDKVGTNNKQPIHCLKAITTIESISTFCKGAEEYRLRMVYFLTKKVNDWNPSTGWEFSDVPSLYSALWDTQGYKIFVRDCLFPVIMLDNKEYPFPVEYTAQIKLIIATGLYIGIWQNINEALEFFERYWSWILKQGEEGKDEIVMLVEDYIKNHTVRAKIEVDNFNMDKWTTKQIQDTSIDAATLFNAIKANKGVPRLSIADEDKIKEVLRTLNWGQKINYTSQGYLDNRFYYIPNK